MVRASASIVLLTAALFSAASSGVVAQSPTADPGAVTCTGGGGAVRFGASMPLELLDYLERIARSPFAHAYLIHYVAQHGAEDHWLTKCAKQFINLDAHKVDSLHLHLIEAPTIIGMLRSSEEARIRAEQIRAAADRTLPRFIEQLQAVRDRPTLEANEPYFLEESATECQRGQSTLPICQRLSGVIDRISRLRAQHDSLDAAAARLERWTEQFNRESAALRHATEHLDALLAADPPPLEEEVNSARQHAEDLKRAVEGTQRTRDIAETALVAARDSLRAADTALGAALRALRQGLASQSTLARQPISPPAADRVTTRVALTAPAPASLAAPGASARSASIVVELADFVVDRAKQELVFATIANMYSWTRDDTLMVYAFRNTHELMASLATGTNLTARAAGRIPLTMWRTTLVSDFQTLPLNVLDAPRDELCGRLGASATAADTVRVTACSERTAGLRAAAQVSRRLLRGDPVFDVIRNAHVTLATASQAQEWQSLLRGLSMVATLAEAFQAQGFALSADPVQHPYVLSSAALPQMHPGHHRAFMRLLLVRALPRDSVVARVEVQALQDALQRGTQLLEAIATLPAGVDLSFAQNARTLRFALDALAVSTDFASAFAPNHGAQLGRISRDWEAFAQVVEPIVARDFSLAAARGTVLLRNTFGPKYSPQMLTLTSLAASLAEAQDGAQVRSAFESAAAPVGGWQAKRYGDVRTTLTAFPGFALGHEWLLRGTAGGRRFQMGSLTAGVALPIGPEFQLLRRTEGMAPPACRVCSVGFFTPIVDLGALVNYRLSEGDAVTSEPTATFRQVFAPGAFLTFGMGRSFPVTVLAGGQFMPALRKVGEGDAARSRHVFRIGTAIVFDLVLLEF